MAFEEDREPLLSEQLAAADGFSVPTGRSPGKPSKYTEETVNRILDCLRLGMPRKYACESARISYGTLCKWLNPKDEQFKPELVEAVEEATAYFVKANASIIQRAALAGTWQAASWLLERRIHQDYGRQVMELQGPDGSEPTIKLNISIDGAVPEEG